MCIKVTFPKTKNIKQQKKEQAAINRIKKEKAEKKKEAAAQLRRMEAAERGKNRVDFLIAKRKRSIENRKTRKARKQIDTGNKQLYKGIDQFFDTFKTNEDCLTLLEKIFWPDGIVCPYCEKTKIWTFKTNRHHHKCATCLKQFNVKTGTIFACSKLPIRKIFLGITRENLYRGGVTAKEFLKDVGVSYKTAYNQLKKIRRYGYDQELFALVMKDAAKFGFKVPQINTDNPYCVDTTQTDGDNRNRHKHKKRGYKGGPLKAQTYMAIQKDGYARGKVIPDLTANTMIQTTKELIPAGSLVFSDTTASLNKLPEIGYQHETVNHSANEHAKVKLSNDGKVSFISNGLVEWLNGIYKTDGAKHQNRFTRFGRGLFLNGELFRVNTSGFTESDKFLLALTIMSLTKRIAKKEKKGIVKINNELTILTADSGAKFFTTAA